MYISNAQIQEVFKLHLHKVQASGLGAGAPVLRPDQLIISKQASEMRNIIQFVSEIPEVRQDKVRQLRAMIEQETFQVSDLDIADSIVSSMV